MIFLLGALVVLLAVAGISAPWWWQAFARRAALRRRAANVAAYRTRLAELDADVAGGVLPADSAEATRQELGARLLQDVDAQPEHELDGRSSYVLPVLLALVLLAFGGTWYAVSGSWRTQDLIELAKSDPEAARQQSVNESITHLRERVAAHPEELESWVWLARSYRARESYDEAAHAFAKANELRGYQDPDLLVEEGEAFAYTQERSMAGLPAERFQQALTLAPAHPQALWFAGIAALQAHDDRAAIGYWERLQQQDLPDDMRSVIAHSLAQLRERNGIKPPKPALAAAPAGALQLKVQVSLAPELASAVQPGDSLFVYAQDPSGPPMPLAVQRLSAAQLPLTVTLDDSMSPMPTRKLSSVERWRVVARVSRAGTAMPQSGDLEGSLDLDRAGAAHPVRLVINGKRP